MKLNAMKVNSRAIEAGEWVGTLPEMGDLELRVRGIGNTEYRALYTRLVDALPRTDKVDGRPTPDAAERVVIECVVETILLDWRGVEDDVGNPVAFNKDQARALLSDPDFRPFRDAVMVAAARVSDSRAADAEAAAKN